MLDLCEGDEVEELDEELAGDVGLVAREAFDSDEDNGRGNDKGEQGVDPRGGEERKPDWFRVGRGRVGRFVSARGREEWHSYGGGLDRW